MSKKNVNVAETAEAVETKTFTNVLDAIRTTCEGKEPSLRAFAMALDVIPTRLYTKAKTPIAGQVWDPNVVNWEALNEFFVTKLEAEGCPYDSMEALVAAAAEKDVWLSEHTVARTSAVSNLIEVDGNMVPKRKAAIFEMGSEKESLLCFKKDPNVYKMVYQTQNSTCIRAVNEDGSFAKDEVRVISNSTLNTKCVPPVNMPKAIEDRFSGAYAEQTKSEADAESENANQSETEE